MTTRTYERELRVATELALRAGARLREEFHRPGGPRGAHDHADVDEEAETLISEGLRAAFPDDAYTGEETGTRGAPGAARRWYVDPNDGTSAFLDGRRGSAVSIGLAVDGVPVLGVVYAPTAPDDAGDLVTWAEGEPLRRNGATVNRARLPDALDGLAVVATNTKPPRLADDLALVEPARLLVRPSIAYRLALVAVGEADATLSLNHPSHYDVAGGHAVLRGAGGELVDAGGRPFRYGARGTTAADVFGGSLAVATWLAARAQARGHRRRPAAPAAPALDAALPRAAPSHAHKVADAAVLARAHGALLGQVAGDALGQLVEFRSAAQIARSHPGGVRELVDGGTWDTLAGQPTDDSELALVLARSIVRHGGFDPAQVRAGYRGWLASRPFDVGGTTSAGLNGRSTADSESNGAAMRVSPLAVHLWRATPDEVARLASLDAGLSHQSPVCAEASAALSVAIAIAVREGPPPRELYAQVARWARRDGGLRTAVRDVFSDDDVAPVEEFYEQQGWVLIALRNAFHQLLHAPTLEEGLVRTVSAGGDTDTNGAIAGALLGAVHGREAVPLRWRRAVLTCRAITGHHPRPMALWADDLLELAERLVALGAADGEAA